jgi:hypothetical protein
MGAEVHDPLSHRARDTFRWRDRLIIAAARRFAVRPEA